jgi:hypothetical protein
MTSAVWNVPPRTPRWIQLALGATLVFNLLDLLATIAYVDTGLAVEANPVMAVALCLGYAPFALCKLSLVSAGVMVLWKHRARLLARVGSITVCAAYSCVIAYHTAWGSVLLR